MKHFTYTDSAIPIRDDLQAANRRQWERLAHPGSWWDGVDRVAIAREIRAAEDCAFCAERKQALSAASIEGAHDCDSELPETVVEVVHKLVTDNARLSKAWFDDIVPSQLSDAAYAEIVGIVVNTFSVDELQRGMGVAVEPLPQPVKGEPSQRRPLGAKDHGSWLPTVAAEDLDSQDADLYGGAAAANVIAAMSLVPGEVRGLLDLGDAYYMPMGAMNTFEQVRSLTRSQVELVAARTSALNECFY
jgi:hypothetical protein